MIKLFDHIHSLLQGKNYDAVVGLLYNAKTAHIESPYNQNTNHAWYILGDIAFKTGKYLDAIAFYTKSLEAKDSDSEAALALANSYFGIGRPDKAEEILRKSLRSAPRNDDALYNCGNALFDQNKFEEAAKFYKKVSSTNPEVYELSRRNLKIAETRLRSLGHTGPIPRRAIPGRSAPSGQSLGGTTPNPAAGARAAYDAMPPVALLRPTHPRHRSLQRTTRRAP